MPVLFVAAAQLFDYLSFMLMVWRHGTLGVEANPLVVRVAGELGIPGLTAVKLWVVVITVLATLVLRPKHPRLAATVFVLSVAGGLLGGVSNIATF